MNFKSIYLTLGLLVLLSANLLAQKNSILKGKVFDRTNQEVLPGASVYISGTNLGTYTDLQGEFQLAVQAGDISLSIQYLGYSDTTFTVKVQEGETKYVEVPMQSALQELSTITLTGSLQGQARALNQQKNADNVKNVISSDQMGRFPDPNVAEALQRVQGVNIERDQGEGRYVLVRGLAPQFTNMNVNGEQIPSPEADVRFVALDAIPADQLASIEVSKTLTPDMDGDAIGGSVNLVTKKAESKTPSISATLASGYNHLMGKPNLQGSFQVGKRFGESEKLGILINTSYYHNDLGSDNLEREPFDNELELRDYELTRTRMGLSGTIDYNLSKSSNIYFRTLYSRFTDREWRRRYIFIPEDGEIERTSKDRFESQSILAFNLGAKHLFPKFQVDYEVQYSYGEQDTPYDYEGTFIAGIDNNIEFSDPKYPGLSAPGYLDNTEYEFDELETGSTIARDRNITGKFNIGIPYKVSGSEGLIKFGAKVRMKEKSFDITQNKFENMGGVPNLDSFEGGLLDDDFLGGKYQLAKNLDVASLIKYMNENPEQFELQIEDKAIDEALESFEARENVYAGYLMARQQFKRLMVIGGVRYEKTSVDYKSSDVIIAPNGDLMEIRPVEGKTDYDFILPQVNLKYAWNKFTNIRAAATYSYARPNFSEIVPSQEANLEDGEATVGNTALKPVSAMNLDLLAERYFGNVGVLSGGVFHKRLENFIYRRVLFDSQYPLTGTPVATGLNVTQAQNGQDATLTGFELAFQRNMDFLPGVLSHLSLYLNYTYTNSEATIQSREASDSDPNRTEKLRLPGQASNVGNVSLAYQSKKLTLRLSANFNGEYLSEVGESAEHDYYVNNRMQMDLSANYTISEKVRIFTEFLNLTNQPFEVYQGSEDVLVQREFYSWWSRFGVKVNW